MQNAVAIGGVDGAYHNAVVDVFSGVLLGGLEINILSSTLEITNNRWNNDGSQSWWNSNHEGIINAEFLNGNSEIEIGGLSFVNQQEKTAFRAINKRVKRA